MTSENRTGKEVLEAGDIQLSDIDKDLLERHLFVRTKVSPHVMTPPYIENDGVFKKEVKVARVIATRMGIDKRKTINYGDGDPKNLRRDNLSFTGTLGLSDGFILDPYMDWGSRRLEMVSEGERSPNSQ